ncbi:flavodoxin family protein, partial [Clostridium sp. CMCC3678]
ERLTERYKEMLKKNPNDEHIVEQLKNHEEAKVHPNQDDMENAKKLVEYIFKKVN